MFPIRCSRVAQLVALAAAGAAASGSVHAAPAQFECYDFSGLAVGSKYTVGDMIDARYATITIKPYFINGTPAAAEVRGVTVNQSQIAGGPAPEARLYLVTVNVVPKSRATRVRMNVAQSIAQDGAFANANIEVNGEKHESPSGIAGLDGKIIGRPANGKAKLSSSITPQGGGNWHSGTLEIRADPGNIESFSLGMHSGMIDNLCFAK